MDFSVIQAGFGRGVRLFLLSCDEIWDTTSKY